MVAQEVLVALEPLVAHYMQAVMVEMVVRERMDVVVRRGAMVVTERMERTFLLSFLTALLEVRAVVAAVPVAAAVVRRRVVVVAAAVAVAVAKCTPITGKAAMEVLEVVAAMEVSVVVAAMGEAY